MCRCRALLHVTRRFCLATAAYANGEGRQSSPIKEQRAAGNRSRRGRKQTARLEVRYRPT